VYAPVPPGLERDAVPLRDGFGRRVPRTAGRGERRTRATDLEAVRVTGARGIVLLCLLVGVRTRTASSASMSDGTWDSAHRGQAVLTTVSIRAGESRPAQGDTGRPRLPLVGNLPQDSTLVVERPGVPRTELLYYRNIVGLIFDDTTSGATIRRLLARYSASIIGGVPGIREYVVQIPDPGRSFAALETIVHRLNSESGVALARKMYYRTPVYPSGDHPKD